MTNAPNGGPIGQSPTADAGTDTVVLSLGHQREASLEEALAGWGGDVHVIGDCLSPRTVEETVVEASKWPWSSSRPTCITVKNSPGQTGAAHTELGEARNPPQNPPWTGRLNMKPERRLIDWHIHCYLDEHRSAEDHRIAKRRNGL